MLTYVVNVFSQSNCFEHFLGVYAAGRPPTANQITKHRSISEIINPLLNEAQFVFAKTGRIFAKTGKFYKNRDFLRAFLREFFNVNFVRNFAKNREFLQKPGFFTKTGIFSRVFTRDF